MSAAHYGRAFVYGDGINTDMLAPGIYMKHPIATIAQHCLESVDPDFARTVQPGDVVVAGQGFGIGSSREQAAEALKHLGVAAVLARSYGGIFYRNALNFGLPVLVCSEVDQIGAGDLVHRRSPRPAPCTTRPAASRLHATPLPQFLLDMIADGGLVPHLEKRFAAKRAQPAPERRASFRRSPGARPSASSTAGDAMLHASSGHRRSQRRTTTMKTIAARLILGVAFPRCSPSARRRRPIRRGRSR